MPDDKRSQYTMRSMQTDLEALKGGGSAEKSVAVPKPVQKPDASAYNAPPPNLPHASEPQRPSTPAPPPRPLPPLQPSQKSAEGNGPAMRNLRAEPAPQPGPPPLTARTFAKPAPTPKPATPTKPAQTSVKRSKRVPLLIFGALLIVLLIGVEVWWFFIRPDAVDPIVKPPTDGLTRPEDTLPTDINEPPPPGVEQATVAEPLLAYAETDTVTLQSTNSAAVVAALNLAVSETRTAGRPTRIVFLAPQGNIQKELSWSELSSALQFSIPASVQSQLTGSYNLFVMPKTAFDESECTKAKGGQDCAGPRLGIALAASDSAALQSSVRSWEATMVQDLRHLIVANISGETRPFLDASYRGASVRYRNLPLPTVTIDYALTQQKLIITTSKSLMFAALDSL